MRAFNFLRSGERKPAVVSGGLPDPTGSQVQKEQPIMTAIPIFAKAQNPIQEGRVVMNDTLADTILSTMNYRGQRRLKATHTRTLAAMIDRKSVV